MEALIRRAVQAQNTTTNPDQNYDIYSRNFKLFLSLFLFRALNSLFVNTWFDPDETWQSLEVAHHTVWGVGAITWYVSFDALVACYRSFLAACR